MYHYRIWVYVKDLCWPQENQGIWGRNGCVSRRDNWQPHVCWQYYLPQSCWSVCGHRIFISQQNALILRHRTPHQTRCSRVCVSWSGSATSSSQTCCSPMVKDYLVANVGVFHPVMNHVNKEWGFRGPLCSEWSLHGFTKHVSTLSSSSLQEGFDLAGVLSSFPWFKI